MKKCALFLIMVLLLSGLVWADNNDESLTQPDSERLIIAKQAFNDLKTQFPALKAYKTGPLVQKLYGQSFGTGSSPEIVVDQFINNHADIFGVDANDLISRMLNNEKTSSVPVMWIEETQSYKFTQFYYTQQKDGVPVYGAELRLLVRNEANFPLVLASSTLRDLDNFTADKSFVDQHSVIAEQSAKTSEPGLTDFTKQESVIWAGTDSRYEKPVNAVTFIGTSDFPEKFRYVINPVTGEILYKENLIIFEDVPGNVSGYATEGVGAEQCEDEILQALRYARVNTSTTVAYTDGVGDFLIDDGGIPSPTVESRIWGLWFRVYNYTGADAVLSGTPTHSGIDFIHNSTNTETVRSQVNAYVEANKVRDRVITYNPSYPTLNNNEFPIYVNRTDGYCPGNAWYDPGDVSLNFCSSGGGYPNTAWSSIIHHEYGHHLVNAAGSGQGQYGEGMGDCMSVLLLDSPLLGFGFFGDCTSPLRNADNTHQYPCVSTIHDCGQLLSGCVWDTRNELLATNPGTYMEILSNLTINSILLHTGTEITPQITIDFLTLDDDDANLDNGTPHYMEICAGFGPHNMDCPDINPILFSYPDGIPTMLNPNQPTTFRVVATGNGGEEPQSGSGMFYYSVDGGSYTSVSMTENSPNDYNAVIPGLDCYSSVNFYVSCDLVSGGTFYDPLPSSPNNAVVATSISTIFADNFETNQGWTVSGNAGDGQWNRGDPVGGGDRGDPADDYDGSGQCYLTDNVDDNSDVDDGTTTLTSPTFDLSTSTSAQVHYAFWYSNNNGADPNNDVMQMYISDNNGSSWVLLEELGPTYHANGGWYEYTYLVTDFVSLTSQVKVRFDVSDLGDGSVIEAGLDDFQIIDYACEGSTTLIITTTDLPDWTIGIAYSQTLEATGGTGALTWTDKYSDLVGSGLSLSTDGILSGTPSTSGSITFTAEVVDEAKSRAADEQVLSFEINPAVSITTSTIPDWTAGYSYSQQLTSTGGTGTISWLDKNNDLSGTGLTLSGSGLLSGTPVAGSISFTAQATDGVGSIDEGILSLTVNSAITITTASLPEWTAGFAYSEQLDVTGGTGLLAWADKNGNLAGTGLTLSTTGLLSGTPVAGAVSFTAEVTDVIGATGEKVFNFTINATVSISTSTLSDWTEGIPYSQTLTTTGGTGAITWVDKNGDLAGTGLTLSVTGLLSGTPVAGPISFTAEASDAVGSFDEKVFSFDINNAVSITTSSLPDWTAGYAYSQQLTSTGGTGTISWIDKNNDLSGTGLTLSSSGLLSGTPVAGSISFTAQATDGVGSIDEGILSFTVNPAITITTVTLPDWTAGFAYSQQLEVTGGTGALVWVDKYDDLSVTGITLSATGLLSGTPVAGAVSFTAEVTDVIGATGNDVFSFTVNQEVSITTTSLQEWTVGIPYSIQLESSGGTGSISWVDKYGDLVGTGLSLATDGNLTGTPTPTGPISFTAEASDAIGSTADQSLTLTINPSVVIITTSLPDWTADYSYSQQLDATGGTGVKSWSDKYNDLTATGLTLSVAGLISGTPLAGPISFTAEVVDEAGDTEEVILNFTVNDALLFVTTSFADGTEGLAYSEQVDVSGGTGVVIYSDLNNDLSLYGLNISSTGLVSGTPTDTGTVEFTIYIEDDIGANTQQVFTVYIEIDYICGDANNDGLGPNVADLTYLVNYIFKGGPPPTNSGIFKC